jgi:hypothetical protein
MSSVKGLVNQYLAEINHRWNVSFLQLNDDDQCDLKTNDCEFSFALSLDGGEIVFWSPVTLAAGFIGSPELLLDLLILNHDQQALRGTTFSIDPERSFIFLNYRVPVDAIDANSLSDVLLNFSEMAENGHQLLAELSAQHVSHNADVIYDFSGNRLLRA